MKLEFDFSTASLKDAEHAIFLIGAYFGMTNLPSMGVVHSGSPSVVTDTANLAPSVVAFAGGLSGSAGGSAAATDLGDPAEIFGAGEPDNAAQVFGGNVAGTAAAPGTPTALPAMAAPSVATAAAPVGSPAAPAPAPVASVPPGVELDVDGLPWDARINANGEGGTKPKNADGRWRKKRGLNDEALIKRVQAELRQTLAAGVPPAPPQAPAPAVAPVAAPTVPPVAPLPPAPPVAPSVAVDPTTFEQLMPRVTSGVLQGTLSKDALREACVAYGLPNIPALAQRADLVPYVWQYMKQLFPALQ